MSTIRSQIDAFKEKVSLCSTSFSLVTCADSISVISTQHHSVGSVNSVRLFVEGNRTDRDRQTRDLVVYAQWFLDTVNYIRELKSNFQSRVYQPLMSSQPYGFRSDTYRSEGLVGIAEKASQLLFQLDTLLDSEGENNFRELTVDKILDRKGVPSQERAVIRLIPSALSLLNELSMLATNWLALAAETRAQTETKDVHSNREALLEELSMLKKEIDSGEKELEIESEELHTLLEREERSNKINGENHTLEVKMNGYRDKLTEVRLQMSDTQELIGTSENNSRFKYQLLQDLNAQKKQAAELELKMKVLRYQMDIVEEDLCVELEVKPSIIRLTNSVQDKCMKLESSLEIKRSEKKRIEQALRPTNT